MGADSQTWRRRHIESPRFALTRLCASWCLRTKVSASAREGTPVDRTVCDRAPAPTPATLRCGQRFGLRDASLETLPGSQSRQGSLLAPLPSQPRPEADL